MEGLGQVDQEPEQDRHDRERGQQAEQGWTRMPFQESHFFTVTHANVAVKGQGAVHGGGLKSGLAGNSGGWAGLY